MTITKAQSSAEKGHTGLGQQRNKHKSTGSTTLERKVQHLDKEKKRRWLDNKLHTAQHFFWYSKIFVMFYDTAFSLSQLPTTSVDKVKLLLCSKTVAQLASSQPILIILCQLSVRMAYM